MQTTSTLYVIRNSTDGAAIDTADTYGAAMRRRDHLEVSTLTPHHIDTTISTDRS
jgi:hypothetical protein